LSAGNRSVMIKRRKKQSGIRALAKWPCTDFDLREEPIEARGGGEKGGQAVRRDILQRESGIGRGTNWHNGNKPTR